MSIYTVYVGDHFIKAFPKEEDADFLKESLDIFFQMERLHFETSIKCEVTCDA